jgi:hypothetical protein
MTEKERGVALLKGALAQAHWEAVRFDIDPVALEAMAESVWREIGASYFPSPQALDV